MLEQDEIIDSITDYIPIIRKKKNFFDSKNKCVGLVKIILFIIFFPVLLTFSIFESHNFVKVLKQISVLLYCIFFLVFLYSILTFNLYKKSLSTSIIEINFITNVKNFD